MRHLAISAANFSISTLVLLKQHRFRHRRRFSQVHIHKNRIKIILHTDFKYDTFEMQEKTTVVTCRKYHWYHRLNETFTMNV